MQFKALVKKAFDKSAQQYNEYTALQREIAGELLEILYASFPDSMANLSILDLGCGTGYIGLLNKSIFKHRLIQLDLSFNMCKIAKNDNSNAITVNGDIEQLPFRTQSFDILLSASTMQWLENLEHGFHEMYSVLKPSGMLFFTTFGTNTLYELRKSFEILDDDEHVNKFISDREIEILLKKVGFMNIQKKVCTKVLYFADVLHIMRYLHNLGANFKGLKKYKYLFSKEKLAKLNEIYYKSYRNTQGLATTWEIYYFQALKR